MDIQTVIISIIIILCVVFVGLRIYRLLSGKGKSACDSCTGCALKNTCQKK
ncbi:FeoB-associated Cys-rich membrane protein [Bacteroides caecigallinarum]|uniref:FeoB-associated Cys-rich membrane protein n=1 Tax=Bacteroides sp. TaxID=29523 RepID=UPI0012ABD4E2|nr:FeoB-associated Cys-rich membrane protein [Bacteroides caecigallinarum]MCF2737616.1 FeoB-associated Cys-rich membrane protein [Bacteroides caecigallinarum]